MFSTRFPHLAKILTKEECQDLKIELAKDNTYTAYDKNLLLHSKYNPKRESENIVKSFNREKHKVAVFLAFGLGWSLISFAENFPDIPIIVIESNKDYFFKALEILDWTKVFNHKNISLLINAEISDSSKFLSKYKTDEICFYCNDSQCNHDKEYFKNVLIEFNKIKEKENINTNTLEKFSKLWLKNTCKNLHYLAELDGIKRFINKAENLPFVILAAGPSLEKIIPHLEEIKKRAVIVCVDTALHACLKAKVEPDFIIIVDPQYYCALHLEFLESPSSIMILESAVYPSAFRFKCKEKILCSSMFPIGQYFESKIDYKGKLGAGGSVTTTAWDFARICNAKEIFLAGMDLGFPSKQTHIRGSQFEEKIHRESNKFNNAENSNINSIITAMPEWKYDYDGKPLLTDKKMSLFSWWFENNCKIAKENNIKTFTLCPESLKIEGIEKYDLNNFLSRNECIKEKEKFLNLNESPHKEDLIEKIKIVKNEFNENLNELLDLSEKAIVLCEKALKNTSKLEEINQSLNEIDIKILNSKTKECAALVFPTERQLKEISISLDEKEKLYPIKYSKIIYKQIIKSVKLIKKYI